jgi:hypothetical protein
MKDFPAVPTAVPEPSPPGEASSPPLASAPPQPHRYYQKHEAGAPLPPDLPPDAQRYRLVEEGAQDERQWVAIGCVVAMVAAGVWLVWVDAPKLVVDVPFVLAGLAIVWAAWGRWRAVAPRFVPSASGEYVIATRSMIAAQLGSLAAPERVSKPARIVCGALGVSLIVAALALSVADLLAGEPAGLLVWLIAAVIGAWLTHVAMTGEYAYSREEPEIPPSPWFHSLADPSRPLPDDAPVSGAREPAGGARERPGS